MDFLLLLGAVPLCLLAVALGSVLAGVGLVSPYLAAAATLLLSTFVGLPLPLTAFTIVGTYLGGILLSQAGSDGAATAEPSAMLGNRRLPVSDEYLRSVNYKCVALKVIALLGGALITVPAFPPLTGPIVLVGACALAIYAAKGLKINTLLAVVLQSALLYLPLRLMGDSALNPILGLISAVAIPAILFAPYLRAEEQAEFYRVSHVAFRYLFIFFALVLSLSTPGYSLSCIVSGLFPRNISRLHHLAFLEGWMEGYVIRSVLDNSISGKTPLGDLLAKRPLFLDTAEISPLVDLAVILGILAALATVYFALSKSNRLIPMPSVPSSLRRNFLLFALTAQAFVTIGMWTLPLLALGTALHFLREVLDPRRETLPLALLLPISMT